MIIRIFSLSIILSTASLFAAPDPCLKDYKSDDCQSAISSAIFFYGNHSSEQKAFFATEDSKRLKTIQSFYERYGIDGLVFKPENRSSLLEKVFNERESNLDFLKEKIWNDWKKGTLIGDQNIFQVMIKKTINYDRELDNLIYKLDHLFPLEGNSNLEKTAEKFGLPWDDKNFLDGYIKELDEVIAQIDRSNEFFKRNENIEQKEKILKIIERLRPLSKLHTSICEAKTKEEIEQAKIKLPGIFQSSEKDVIGCLLKNKQCELVEDLIKSGEYPVSKLKDHFDTLYHIDNTPLCGKAMKATYLAMIENGVRPGKYYFQQERSVLYNLPDYLKKYSLSSEPYCEMPMGADRHTIDALDHSMTKVLQLNSFDILDKIQKEKDLKQKDELIGQLKENLKVLQYDGAGKNPNTGKTLLGTLAESADLETFESLLKNGLTPYDLGYADESADKNNTMAFSISSGELPKLQFAFRVFELMKSDEGLLYQSHGLLKRLHPKDPATKDFRDHFKSLVKAEISRIY